MDPYDKSTTAGQTRKKEVLRKVARAQLSRLIPNLMEKKADLMERARKGATLRTSAMHTDDVVIQAFRKETQLNRLQDLRQEFLLNGSYSSPSTSSTRPPSTSSTIAPPSSSKITPYPCTAIPKEFEWIHATSTPEERQKLLTWLHGAADDAGRKNDRDECMRLFQWVASVMTTIAKYPAPHVYERYLLYWSNPTSENAAPDELKRLFKWKHSTLRSAAPDERKRWSLQEEILKLFETATQIVQSKREERYALKFRYTRQEHVIYSCEGEPGLYQCRNALWIWPKLIRDSKSSALDDGPQIVAEDIIQLFPRHDMIEERPTNELGFVTVKLSGKWIAKSIHKMLKDGIDSWAPKLDVKRVIVGYPSPECADWFRLFPIVNTLMRILEYSKVDVTIGCRMNMPESFQWDGMLATEILYRWFPCEERGDYMVIKGEVPFILPKTDFENAYKDIFALGHGICEQKADWVVYVTPTRQQVYIETCIAAAKLEGWIPNDRHKPPRISYAGYRSCTMKETENLLDIAERSHVAVSKGGAAKLLGYKAEEVLDCVFRYTSLVNHRLGVCVFDIKMMFDDKENTFVYLLNTRARIRRVTNDCRKDIVKLKKAPQFYLGVSASIAKVILEKDEWKKGDARMLGFHLLKFTEALEESSSSVMPHILCEYLYDLAKKFNSYHSCVYKDGSVMETNTLLLYEATDVVMEKCFNLLGISPGVVMETFSHPSGITLLSSLIKSPVTSFRRALLSSTVERPMDVNARVPTRIFGFELNSFRTIPRTPLWYDKKGRSFGQIMASAKLGLRGSHFCESDFLHEDWRNPLKIIGSELPVNSFCLALSLSTMNRRMDVNARDPTSNFRFELFSFRTLPHTPLWNDNKGLIFGNISASDKFGLQGSHFEPDFVHVSLFNVDCRKPIKIIDSGLVYLGNPSSGHPVSFSFFVEICLELYVTTSNKDEGYQVCDHKKDIDLSDFWDKRSDGVCGRLSLGVENGNTELYYMLLRDAVDTSLKMKFNTKMAFEVCGYVIAYYGDDFLYESQSKTETICKDCYMAFLFRESSYVIMDDYIPLIKSVLAVPTKGSLIIKVYLEDTLSKKVIMNETCKFQPLRYNCSKVTTIGGMNCSLDITVSWDYQDRYDGKEILSCSK